LQHVIPTFWREHFKHFGGGGFLHPMFDTLPLVPF
jgi:hypothetical protein